MKRSILVLGLFVLSGLLLPRAELADHGNPGFAAADNFQIRSETHLKCRTSAFYYSENDLGPCLDPGLDPFYNFNNVHSIKLEGSSKGFIDIPRLASKFVAQNDDTVAVITFSGMHNATTVDDEPLIVRALVDGQEAQPGPIVFTAGFIQTKFGISSFTFTTTVAAGVHIVQMQWSSESNTKATYLRNASLFISVDSQDDRAHRVAAKGRKLVSPINKAGSSWTLIPQTALTFNMPEKGTAALTFSSVLKMDTGDYILVRAVIDDGAQPALPVENTLAHRAYHLGARNLTFTTGNLKPGTHKVHFEWKSSVSGGVASASLQAWSVSAITGPRETKHSFFGVVPVAGLPAPTWPDFQPIPTLNQTAQAWHTQAALSSCCFSSSFTAAVTSAV